MRRNFPQGCAPNLWINAFGITAKRSFQQFLPRKGRNSSDKSYAYFDTEQPAKLVNLNMMMRSVITDHERFRKHLIFPYILQGSGNLAKSYTIEAVKSSDIFHISSLSKFVEFERTIALP